MVEQNNNSQCWVCGGTGKIYFSNNPDIMELDDTYDELEEMDCPSCKGTGKNTDFGGGFDEFREENN